MDQLLAIRAFAHVVETGNFTRAADSLEMPKATVSKLVQTLEAHLGVQLLSRTTRRVAVTPDGAAYYDQTARVIKELEDIDAGFTAARARPRGLLKVNVGSSVASQIVLPALPGFLERFPEIRIDFGVSDRDVDLIGDNVDCVIRGNAVTDTALIARVVGHARWVTCAAPAYVARFDAPKHPRALETDHRLVHYQSARTGRVLPMRFLDRGRSIEIDARRVLGVNESNAHFAAGLAGVGVVQTFAFLAEPAIARGELVPLLTRFAPRPYAFHLAYPPNRHVSHRLRVFIDWIVELFRAA
ncbi:MAG TPA: LysR family transcriptional regulator [Kofleriaceae bacterium]|nr:LysR family transcriptional regulator [Kofleriaceae bacterium]